MLAMSFADFSFWCYECDSYVIHELLTHSTKEHPDGFYNQKFGGVSAGEVLEKIRESKHDQVIKEEDENDDD
jgi:hypothetical protein